MTNLVKCEKDERVISVENAGYSLVYKVMSFALLADVVFRSVVQKQPSWDLLGIIVLGGFVAAVYQARHRTIGRGKLVMMFTALVVAAVVAAAVIILRALN